MPEIGQAAFKTHAGIAAASSVDLGSTNEWLNLITGNTTINGFANMANKVRFVYFSGTPTLTHSSALILQGGANITVQANTLAVVWGDAAGDCRLLVSRGDGKAVIPPGAPTVQIFTSSGTWNKPTGLTAVISEVVGGGGGSGGVAATAGGQIAVARGGGGGGYSMKRIAAASLGSTETVTIGAAGTAGSSGNNNGGAGGTTSFGAHHQATGGGAGTGGAAGASASGAGIAGGVGSGGDINISGHASTSGSGFFNTVQMINASSGGGSRYGAGGVGAIGGVGAVGENYGGGAGGSSNAQSSSARAGAAGAAGINIVTEFYS